MSAIMAKIMAFFMSIMYFFGSFGLGSNDPVTINVTDANGEPVSEAWVYFEDEPQNGQEIMVFSPIGKTDAEGNVQWEDQKYGEQTIYVCHEEEFEIVNSFAFTTEVSRTSNETIYIQLNAE